MEFDRRTRTSPPLSICYTREHAYMPLRAASSDFSLEYKWRCVVDTRKEGVPNGRRNVEIEGIKGKNVTHFPLDF